MLVINRVRVLGSGPHTSTSTATQLFWEYRPPPPPPGLIIKPILLVVSFRGQIKLEPRPYFSPLGFNSNFPTNIPDLCMGVPIIGVTSYSGSTEISFTYFLYDILLIVVSERSTQLVIIHSRALFELSPTFGHFFLITKFELAFFSLSPHN